MTPPPGAEPPDPTVLELLRGSALAPMLDKPVDHILQDMGLPGLPDLQGLPPLPGMPPLPVIDLSALMRPLTDLASAFGTGQFAPTPAVAPAPAPAPEGGAAQGDPGVPAAQPVAAPPPMDPTQMLSNVGSVLQTVMSLGTSALQIAMTLWQGQAAQEASKKAAAADVDSAALGAQSAGQKDVLIGAAGSVATGQIQIGGVVAKQAMTMAMAPLFIVSGVGQAFLVQQTIQSITEALAITAKTKGELAVHGGRMTKAGTKIPITGAPKGVKSSQDVTKMLQLLGPLMSMGTQGAQAIGQLAKANTSMSAPTLVAEPEDAAAGAGGGIGGGGAAGGKGGGVGGGGGAVGVGGAAAGTAAQPLSPWQGTRAAGGISGAAAASAGAAMPGGGMSSTGSGGSSPYMPMGGAAGAAGAARADDAGSDAVVKANMVTSQHGDEVVGRIEGVTLPVVGATDTSPEPPPDKELTL
ncbi:hypothetical protein [Nocardia thraciensis]